MLLRPKGALAVVKREKCPAGMKERNAKEKEVKEQLISVFRSRDLGVHIMSSLPLIGPCLH